MSTTVLLFNLPAPLFSFIYSPLVVSSPAAHWRVTKILFLINITFQKKNTYPFDLQVFNRIIRNLVTRYNFHVIIAAAFRALYNKTP